MLTVYVDQKDISLLPPAPAPGPTPELRVEFTDTPMVVAMTRSGNDLQIYSYVRLCGTQTDVQNGSAVYSFATGTMKTVQSDSHGFAPMMESMVGTYIKLSALLGAAQGDVVVRASAGRAEVRAAADQDRMNLPCTDQRAGDREDPLESARRLLAGAEGMPADPVRAAQQMDALARTGNGAAQTAMAVYSAVGCGVPKDFGSAAQWARLAAQSGEKDAAGVLQIVTAIPALEQKAAAGDARAQAAAAAQYIGLARFLPGAAQSTLQPALAWALKAAAQNDPAGFQALAVCYEKGIGTPPDNNRAAAARQRADTAKTASSGGGDAAAPPAVSAPAQDQERPVSSAQAARAAAASGASAAAGSKDDHTAYRKAYAQWKKAIANARERRKPKILKALQAIQQEVEQAAKQEYEDATGPFDTKLAELQEKKAKADAALAATGLFQRQERKDRKDAADRAGAELEALQEEFKQARTRMDTRIGGAQREAFRKLPEILAAVDTETPLPEAPDNPYGFTPVPGIDNYAQLREAALSVLADNTRPLTIREMRMRHELIDQFPDDVYRICRDLCDEGAAVGAQKNGTNTYALSESGRWEVEGAKAVAESQL